METYEYRMNKEYANTILKLCKNEKGSKQTKLCRFITSQSGIKGVCDKVVVE